MNKPIGQLIDELYSLDVQMSLLDTDRQKERHDLANYITGQTLVLLDDMVKYRAFQHTMTELKELHLQRCVFIHTLNKLIERE